MASLALGGGGGKSAFFLSLSLSSLWGATQQSGTTEALRQNGKLCLAVGLKYGMLNEAVVDEWDAKRRSG